MELPSTVSIQDIQIKGLYKDAEFEKCCVALRYFASYNKDLKVDQKRYFSMEYEILIEDLKKTSEFEDSPITFYNGASSPLIIVNQKYIIKPHHLYKIMLRDYEYEDNSPIFIYNRLAMTEYAKYFAQNKKYEFVYMDFVVNHERMLAPQRVIFALDIHTVPKTCKNFIELIKGTHEGPDGKKLSYKDTLIHKVWPNGYIQGGDVEHQGGKGGHSIYGKYFEDEGYFVKHDQPGLLGMANDGRKHTNNSQFYVTLLPLQKYDNKFVVFGKVVEGFRVIKQINKLATFSGKPKYEVKVIDCGIYEVNLKKVETKKKNKRY